MTDNFIFLIGTNDGYQRKSRKYIWYQNFDCQTALFHKNRNFAVFFDPLFALTFHPIELNIVLTSVFSELFYRTNPVLLLV
jgi:hypothetical protein